MTEAAYLQTGQLTCHDAGGDLIECAGSGQDGELRRGAAWPQPRFHIEGETGEMVGDRLTGLVWCRDASPAEFPLTWQEGLDYVRRMNAERFLGFGDWRLPNRRELRSLISHQTRRPALPEGHMFTSVFNGWYWSSTSAAISPGHAWYVNLDGGRMFYGGKDQSFMVWPVRGDESPILPVTGQYRCYGEAGDIVDCAGTGQDGELSCGRPWPSLRFRATRENVIDRLTGLCWRRVGDLCGPVDWTQALAAIEQLNRSLDTTVWRLPNINELESLVDCGRHSPALPAGHPFERLQDVYWSSTTSLFETDWAWALYLDKGAIGVGQKVQAKFHVWAVQDGNCGAWARASSRSTVPALA